MKMFRYISIIIILCLSQYTCVLSQLSVNSVTVSLVDTFALRGYPLQPVLNIHIKVTGTGGNLSLQKLTVNSLNQLNSDIDSISIYQTQLNRFSLADYPGEATKITAKKHLTGDSVIFNMNFPLDTGDNYIWVTMDIDRNAVVSHTIAASIPKNGLEIGDNYYPSSVQTPSGSISIMQVYYTCNFESHNGSNEPINWTQQITGGETPPNNWLCHSGGWSPGSLGYPSSAKSGKLNAMLEQEASSPALVNMLISPPINLSVASKPTLTFYHAQVAWCKETNSQGQCTQSNNDELSVFYRIGTSGSWNLLSSYPLATPDNWIKRQLQLPDSASASNVYLGFQGTAQYGYGVCIDSVVLYESQVIPVQVNNIVVSQPVTGKVPQNSNRNPILRVDIAIKGNNGTINLDSLTITSLNTSDTDVILSGAKLYSTLDSVFFSPSLIGSPVSIVGGKMRFNGLNLQLAPGDNYYWICYDVNRDANPGDKLDAQILAGNIHLSSAGTYPATNQSPGGSSTIVQTMFYDNFSSNKGWVLTGNFQEGTPKGLGGGSGNPGPNYAYMGNSVLGTDLSGTGNDQTNLTHGTAYTATSPLIDATYFKNLTLSFYRFLNIGTKDSAVIELQIQGQNTWYTLWSNQQQTITDNTWNNETYSISNILNVINPNTDPPLEDTIGLERKKFYLRFRLGPTGPVDLYSGWNINYLFITGDTIKKDAALVNYYGPYSSCNLTDNEHIKIGVKNTGPSTIDSLPVQFSLNNGVSYVTEVIPGPIGINDTLDYTFSTASDFSKPAYYNVMVRVALPGDNYAPNDSIISQITSIPNYTLPYTCDFDSTISFWTAGGIKSSWNRATPDGDIPSPPDGNLCWSTNNEGIHNQYESSYVESPCFNFTGNEVPMIDMKNSYSTDTTEGAVLQYSLDQGTTWNYAQKDTITTKKWTWYDRKVKTFNDSLGWSGYTWNGLDQQIWEQDRQVLPGVTAGKNKIRFRIAFNSDTTNTHPYAGFGFEDVYIYNAPFDLGVNKIIGLINPGCQNENNPDLKLSVKNFGSRSMHPGDTIILGLTADTLAPVVDTFYIPAGDTLKHLDTIQFRMKKPVKISKSGNHYLSAYVITKTDPYFYRPVSYDTTYTTLVVNPNPFPGLPDTVYSAVIDTFVIQATDSSNYRYDWTYPKNGYTTNTSYLDVSKTGPGYQYLTITNSNTSCHTLDSVFVKILVSDVGVDRIISPVNSCGYGTTYLPTVEIENFGTDTLKTNKIIPVKLLLNSGAVQTDDIKLSSTLAPKRKVQVVLNIPLNLSAPGSDTLMVYTSLAGDTVHSNDTTKAIFQIYGYPTVNLGNNVYVKALTYTIHAPDGYHSYKWNAAPSDTLDSLVVTAGGEYKLTVTDNHNCPASDSIKVHLSIHDLKVDSLVSPVSSCTMPDSSVFTCLLENSGTDTIAAGDTVEVRYIFNKGTTAYERLTLNKSLLPGNTVSFTFTKQVSLEKIGDYPVVVIAKMPGDFRTGNDTLSTVDTTYGNPVVDLGPARNILAYEYTINPGSGYKSYLWQDGSTDSVYVITKSHFEQPPVYWVQVTDKHKCQTIDTAIIFLIDQDLKDSLVVNPVSSCTLSSEEQISIIVKNTGNQTLKDQNVNVSYQINDGTPDLESLVFSGNPGSFVTYNFKKTANLSEPGTYKIFTKIQMAGDVQPENDTLTKTIRVYGTPQVTFGATGDTITVTGYPYPINAVTQEGNKLLWSNGDTTSTIKVTADGSYFVTATNSNGCKGSNSVFVQKSRSAISVTGITIPATGCGLSAKQTVGIKLTNTGNLPLTNQPVSVSYKINSGTLSAQSVSFTGKPKDTVIFKFLQTADMSSTGSYTFSTSCNYPGNADSADNPVIFNVINYNLPVINFGVSNDTLESSSLPVLLNPGSGFVAYEWNRNPDLTTPEYDAKKAGWYWVKVTDVHQCSNSDSVFVEYGTAINLKGDNAALSIYPNPVRDQFYIDITLNNSESPVTIDIFSGDGKQVINRVLSGSNSYHQSIEVNTLPRGVYYIRVNQDNWISSHKIILQ